jgi:hypothetical protein
MRNRADSSVMFPSRFTEESFDVLMPRSHGQAPIASDEEPRLPYGPPPDGPESDEEAARCHNERPESQGLLPGVKETAEVHHAMMQHGSSSRALIEPNCSSRRG